MTDKVYQRERYMKELDARVVSVDGTDMILDRTIFASDSGGQPCDLGTINGCEVKKVTEKNDEVIHTLKNKSDADQFAPGDTVSLAIDWDRRFDHMQNHLGEHMLSGIFKSVYGLDNKGFHLGDTDGTFDLDTAELTDEMIDTVEDKANHAVYEAIPVNVELIHDLKDAEKYPLRKALKVDEDIIVVTVPGVDCVACCCPHLSDTSQIGIIKITGTEKYKGMIRVHFKCGRRAFLDYRQKHRDVADLSVRFSADEFTLLDKIDKAEKKNDRVRHEYNEFRSAVADAEAQKLAASGQKPAAAEIGGADMELLREISKKLSDMTDAPAVLSSVTACCVLLTAPKGSDIQCGKIVKELAENGRGGGGQAQAQAVFKNPEDVRSFAQAAVSEMEKQI